MKPSTTLVLALGFSGDLHAQPTFQKVYESGTSYTLDLIELPGDHILTAMGATLLLDLEGHVEHGSAFVNGGTYLVRTLKLAGINEFYFTTGTNVTACPWGGNTNSLIRPIIGKMDSIGLTQGLMKYELNAGICYGMPGGLEVTNDLGALIWGRDENFYALRANADLDHVWSKKVLHRGGFHFIKELPGGDLLAGMNIDSAAVTLARMDADGNVLWSKSYFGVQGIISDALIESDDAFIVTGYTDSIGYNFMQPLPADFQPKLFMMKVDGGGEVQWCRGWRNSTYRWYTLNPSRIVRALDGNYAVLATLGVPQNNLEFRPILMKTDTNGDTLWTSSAGELGYIYMARSLMAHSDGGYMFSGIVQGDLPAGNTGLCYITKTDSLGRFPCSQEYYPLEVLDLFPVDSSFTLNIEDGLATATPVLVHDSILDPSLFVEYDACVIITDTPQSDRRSTSKPHIRPNPNTGHFTVQFADPLLAESYYSVYDTMGKLLLQRRLPTGATAEEVDLERFGAGTYVVKFTSPDGVCHERVVVE